MQPRASKLLCFQAGQAIRQCLPEGWGDELDSLSLEGLEEYRAELEARLCDMDDDGPEDMAGEEFERWADAYESLEDLLSEVEDRIDGSM